MRLIFVLLAMVALGSCGGRVTGEIGKACVASDRAAANPRLCGCIQSAANRHLNARDQELAATFFADAEKANDIKINDSRAADAFWERYTAFRRTAERSCR